MFLEAALALSRPSSAAATTASSSSTAARSQRSTRSSRRSRSSPTRELQAKTPELQAAASPTARRSTTCCPRPSPWCARPPSACSACATSTCRWSAASRCTTARSRRCAPARARRWSRRCPSYLNALAGKGVHVVTVNDYLAKRDAEWMGTHLPLPRPDRGRRSCRRWSRPRSSAAYAADITYGTNNEFGFDYLRDNMATQVEERFQRGLQLRHRRRGRLDPDRRGAHAAHHLRPGRGLAPSSTARSTQLVAEAHAAEGREERSRAPGDYWVDVKQPPGHCCPRPATSTPRSC